MKAQEIKEYSQKFTEQLGKLTNTIKKEFIRRMKRGDDEKVIFEALRDDLKERGCPELAAANIVRLAINAASEEVAAEEQYSDSERLEMMKNIMGALNEAAAKRN